MCFKVQDLDKDEEVFPSLLHCQEELGVCQQIALDQEAIMTLSLLP